MFLIEPIKNQFFPCSVDFQKFTQKDVQEICNDLIESMVAYEGLGLSANQVGLAHRVLS